MKRQSALRLGSYVEVIAAALAFAAVAAVVFGAFS